MRIEIGTAVSVNLSSTWPKILKTSRLSSRSEKYQYMPNGVTWRPYDNMAGTIFGIAYSSIIIVNAIAMLRWGYPDGIILHDRQSSKRQSLAITCTRAVGGVCAHVVGHSRSKPLQITEECARTRAVHKVVVLEGWVLGRAPADTAGNHGRTATAVHNAARLGRSGGDVIHRLRRDRGQSVGQRAAHGNGSGTHR